MWNNAFQIWNMNTNKSTLRVSLCVCHTVKCAANIAIMLLIEASKCDTHDLRTNASKMFSCVPLGEVALLWIFTCLAFHTKTVELNNQMGLWRTIPNGLNYPISCTALVIANIAEFMHHCKEMTTDLSMKSHAKLDTVMATKTQTMQTRTCPQRSTQCHWCGILR